MNNHEPDKKQELLSLIQTGFPLESRPFRNIADRMHTREKEIIEMLRSLIHERVVREIGPIFDARKLGYTSTLVAVKVEEERAAELAAAMLPIGEITHNYYRDGDFNIWFTITAPDRNIIEDIIRWTEKFTGVVRVLDLPMEQMFKINAVFNAPPPPFHTPQKDIRVPALDDNEKAIIIVLQNGLPVLEQPFLAISEELGLAESFMLQNVRRWIENGVIRRFGVRLDHRRAGYIQNVLAAWDGDHIQIWGKKFAEIPLVSHCYIRRSYPEWPYRLYTMIHARSDAEMENTLKSMKQIASGARVAVLPTRYELKKTTMKYFLEK